MATEQLIEYGQVLAKLHELLGEHVEVAISGVRREPPVVAYLDGRLEGQRDLAGGDLLGYDRDALRLGVGGVDFTIHPDHFQGATWDTTTGAGASVRVLRLILGKLQLVFRTGPASPTS